MDTVEIKTLKGIRKGRSVEMQVQVSYCGTKDEANFAWIKKIDGDVIKPIFGATGYWTFRGLHAEATVLKSYRGDIILENIEIS